MSGRIFSGILLTLLMLGMLTSSFGINPVKANGTIYIRADGSVEPSGAPISQVGEIYTLTGDVNTDVDGIIVQRNDAVIDGAGHTIQGSGNGFGVGLQYTSNVTIRNINVRGFWIGIYGNLTSFTVISGNDLADNEYGIGIDGSSNDVIFGNSITGNHIHGIELDDATGTVVTGNTVASATFGVEIMYSYNMSLSQNRIDNTAGAFGVGGVEPAQFVHSIDVSNLVNGKPIYYLVDRKDLLMNPVTYPQVGHLALVRCDNITVEGLTLEGNKIGLTLACTNNTRITQNNIRNNFGALYINWCSNNTISQNNITNHQWAGLTIRWSSNNNTVYGNNITGTTSGVLLALDSSGNRISRNTIANSPGQGIGIANASGNVICHNNFVNNTCHAWDYSWSGSAQSPDLVPSVNVWDDGYPSGGNFWSGYNVTDLLRGPYQNETGSDGIFDIAYTVYESNTDHYPLVNPLILTMQTDLNGDGAVNIVDISIVAKAFGSKTGDPNWNPTADLNKDGIANILDITLVAKDYGKTV
jgi:parallel beta-helix repeat protein